MKENILDMHIEHMLLNRLTIALQISDLKRFSILNLESLIHYGFFILHFIPATGLIIV